MKITKGLLAALILCLFSHIASAQKEKSFKMITLPMSQDSAFNKIIDFLQDNDIFIQSLDKQAGFVQGKYFLEHKSVFSDKAGERRTLNFILRPEGKQTKVVLTVYMEQYNFGGDLSGRSYYYEDKGIMSDVAVYQDVLNDLRKASKE